MPSRAGKPALKWHVASQSSPMLLDESRAPVHTTGLYACERQRHATLPPASGDVLVSDRFTRRTPCTPRPSPCSLHRLSSVGSSQPRSDHRHFRCVAILVDDPSAQQGIQSGQVPSRRDRIDAPLPFRLGRGRSEWFGDNRAVLGLDDRALGDRWFLLRLVVHDALLTNVRRCFCSSQRGTLCIRLTEPPTNSPGCPAGRPKLRSHLRNTRCPD